MTSWDGRSTRVLFIVLFVFLSGQIASAFTSGFNSSDAIPSAKANDNSPSHKQAAENPAVSDSRDATVWQAISASEFSSVLIVAVGIIGTLGIGLVRRRMRR